MVADMTDSTIVTGLADRHSERLRSQTGISTDSFVLLVFKHFI